MVSVMGGAGGTGGTRRMPGKRRRSSMTAATPWAMPNANQPGSGIRNRGLDDRYFPRSNDVAAAPVGLSQYPNHWRSLPRRSTSNHGSPVRDRSWFDRGYLTNSA